MLPGRAKSGCEQSQQDRSLFNHLVGTANEWKRDGNPELPGSLEIDNERKRRASAYFSARSKFRKSGGDWSLRVGMR
jgi:hypothetical protein